MRLATIPACHRLRLSMLACSIGFALTAHAGEPASTALPAASAATMTLPQALTYARAHQPAIRGALARFQALRSEAQIPRASWYPRLGVGIELAVGSTNNNTGAIIPVRSLDTTRLAGTRFLATSSIDPSVSSLAGIQVSQEVFDFGRYEAQAAAADALAEVARAQAEGVSLDVELGVREAFDAVLASKEVTRAGEDSLRRATSHRDYAAAGVKAQLRPPVDLTRAEAEVAVANVRLIRARSSGEIAQAGLAAAIGSDLPLVDAVDSNRGDEGATAPPTLADSVRAATASNPVIAAAQALVAAQERETSAIARELYPEIAATGGLFGMGGGAQPSSKDDSPSYGQGWLPSVGNWFGALALAWQLDARVLARRRASLAREEERRADLATVKTTLTYDTERAWLDRDAAERALPGLQQAVDAARANQAQAEARFKAGLGTIVDLTDAEALLTGAEVELAVGKFAVARARARLDRAMGRAAHDPGSAR